MLIRNAELDFGSRTADLRVDNGIITALAATLQRRPGEDTVEAQGHALLPALCDHHIHLYALAAANASLRCGAPDVTGADTLARVLQQADAALPPGDWLRGVDFHDAALAGIAVSPRDWLDRLLPVRPLRLQHRSGRLWLLNTAALRRLGIDDGDSAPLECVNGRFTGRLYDHDAWLRARLGGTRPSLAAVSDTLWALGVTALTDTSHGNDADDVAAFAAAQRRGELRQDLLVMGTAALDDLPGATTTGQTQLWRGARKFHLHDHDLPPFETLCAEIRSAHAAGRNVAFHCVSRGELVYAVTALRDTGTRPGDRIEHAGVAPPELVATVRALNLTVVTQPAFIAERGDAYRREVDADDWPWLYPLRRWLTAGVSLAGSSDAPYTDADPWAAMDAAVTRRTRGGAVIGAAEALTPEQAYRAMSGDPRRPGRPRSLAVGAALDAVLLPLPWAAARDTLRTVRPRQVFKRNYHLNG